MRHYRCVLLLAACCASARALDTADLRNPASRTADRREIVQLVDGRTLTGWYDAEFGLFWLDQPIIHQLTIERSQVVSRTRVTPASTMTAYDLPLILDHTMLQNAERVRAISHAAWIRRELLRLLDQRIADDEARANALRRP